MANVVPYSFAQELLKGTHNFPTRNTIKHSIVCSWIRSTLYCFNTAYSSGVANQVGTSGTGYTTGGKVLQNGTVANQTNVATLTFDTISWTSATFGAAYGAIYITIHRSDKLVVVLDFGGTKSCSNGTFTITFPSTSSGTPAGTDSLISITS